MTYKICKFKNPYSKNVFIFNILVHIYIWLYTSWPLGWDQSVVQPRTAGNCYTETSIFNIVLKFGIFSVSFVQLLEVNVLIRPEVHYLDNGPVWFVQVLLLDMDLYRTIEVCIKILLIQVLITILILSS